MKTTVQFRFLQLTLSAVTGDKVTLAAIHWDKQTPRTKFSARNIPPNYPGDTAAIGRGANDLVRKATRLLKMATPSVLGLDELVPVRTGLGASLQWSPVRTEDVADPQAHFDELLALVHLVDPADTPEWSSSRLLHDLRALGKSLHDETEGKVETQHIVEFHHEYVSPLSWKNGAWHHAMALNLARSERESHAATRNLVGQLAHPDFFT